MKKLFTFISKKSISTTLLAITTLIAPFFNMPIAKAEPITTYTINDDIVHFRESPSTSAAEIPYDGFHFPFGAAVTYIGTSTTGDGCYDPWYNVSYTYNGNTYTGYVCSTYVNVTTYDSNSDANTEYEKYLSEQGFPSSYWPKLEALHTTHPNWVFKPVLTGLNWNDALSMESQLPSNIYNAKSLIDGRPTGGNVGYRSTDSRVYDWANDTWTPLESGVWYAANEQTVAYYMDPRNFLTFESIFMFESLLYQRVPQTEAVVKYILPLGPYYDLDNYSADFMAAANDYNISPVHLASRVKQEGAYKTKAGSGQTVECTSDWLKKYYGSSYVYHASGYYNLFNIYATGSDVTCSAVGWASNGYNYLTGVGTGDGTYGRPWNSITQAIRGGAQFLSEKYISVGYNTLYSQKFDIVGPDFYITQFMTNIQAVASETSSSYSAYLNNGIISLLNDTSAFEFNIPVYNNMPESTSLPMNGNPNAYLKNLTIDGVTAQGFNYDTTTYNYVSPTSSSSLSIGATTINGNAKVDGAGNVSIPNATNKINVVVTAENGNKVTYTINVTKSDTAPISIPSVVANMKLTLSNDYIGGILVGTDASEVITKAKSVSPLVTATINNNSGNLVTGGAIGTGYTISINNSQTTSTYTIIERGDTNGDASINIKDLLIIQKHLLKSSSLSGAYYQGADIDKNGNIDIKDLLLVQKHLLGVSSITQ